MSIAWLLFLVVFSFLLFFIISHLFWFKTQCAMQNANCAKCTWINFMSNQNLFQGINNRNFFEAKRVSTFIVPFPKDITRRDDYWVFSNVHYMYIDNCTSFKLARVPRVPLYPVEDIVHFFYNFNHLFTISCFNRSTCFILVHTAYNNLIFVPIIQSLVW